MCLHLQPVSATTLNILIAGNTWAFRSKLDVHCVPGMYVSEGDKQVYYRVIKDLDISESGNKDRVLQMLGERVFMNLAGERLLKRVSQVIPPPYPHLSQKNALQCAC